jgi:adenylosuccinate lyase
MTYTTPIAQAAFEDGSVLLNWANTERAVLDAQAEAGVVPRAWAAHAHRVRVPTPGAWRRATADCGHEVVGFLRAWGVERAHIGLTSSDLVDTGLALRLNVFDDGLFYGLNGLRGALAARALEELSTPAVGRTHGVPAAPDVVGHWMADLAWATDRAMGRLCRQVHYANLSGPTGAFITEALTPAIAARAAELLGLPLAPVASQVVMRDGLATWASDMSLVASLGASVGRRVRVGARHGCAAEGHPEGREGSSAMPHKQNPTDSERLEGLARMARAMVPALAEGTLQWDDHDLAHSSVERTWLPELAGIASYAVREATRLVGTSTFSGSWSTGLGSHAAMTQAQLGGMGYEQARAFARQHPGTDPGTPDLEHLRDTLTEWSNSA